MIVPIIIGGVVFYAWFVTSSYNKDKTAQSKNPSTVARPADLPVSLFPDGSNTLNPPLPLPPAPPKGTNPEYDANVAILTKYMKDNPGFTLPPGSSVSDIAKSIPPGTSESNFINTLNMAKDFQEMAKALPPSIAPVTVSGEETEYDYLSSYGSEQSITALRG